MRIPPVSQPITYRFGVKDSSYRLGFHPGTDYGAPVGTPALACEPGVATYLPSGSAGNVDGSYGNQMKLTLDSGGALYYCHLSAPISQGRVAQGTPLAYTGLTGYVKGAHLHIEYRPTDDLNKPADFELWLKGGDMTITPEALKDFENWKAYGLRVQAALVAAGLDPNAPDFVALFKDLTGWKKQGMQFQADLAGLAQPAVLKPGIYKVN